VLHLLKLVPQPGDFLLTVLFPCQRCRELLSQDLDLVT